MIPVKQGKSKKHTEEFSSVQPLFRCTFFADMVTVCKFATEDSMPLGFYDVAFRIFCLIF